ncbi:hypothetical protein SAMN05518871_104224 [Psychrobacillus sp. OK028]|uniref:hypothetical protein n=1 Tax=Psychrobacillus sp. OK028 TaxID=1884359 RepID=UPI00088D015C|nr:hypothetical protein [Psychrobacillus sp. OK028]SDN30859.1 hypothetical protein SAMN05518871_104224 [Psychrobacillus sp. OK028]
MKRFYLIVIFLLIILFIPIAMWLLEPSNRLNIAIIDKTVPDETYREHKGFTWFLNYLKYVDKEGNSYNSTTSYFGVLPNDEEKSYATRELPDDYTEYEVIYLADLYGVDEQIIKPLEGGMQEEEWKAIVRRLDKQDKSLLIAEFNTFASPTSERLRETITSYLGIEWAGWTGKYFSELDYKINKDIPQSIINAYENTWRYSGAGFLLVNDFTGEVIVLENEKHMLEDGISLTFTAEGEAKFGLASSASYHNWFDIILPTNGSTVLAEYEWSLTEDGKKILEEKGIPREFAAVIENSHSNSSSIYLAGDYNDVVNVPILFQFKGLSQIYKAVQKFSDESFYWSTYVPMMQSILENFQKEQKVNQISKSNKAMKYNARIENNSFELLIDGKWKAVTIKGVNVGMAKPGVFPGEAAITEDEYYRWFEQIGEMNANTIRVYTLHPPGFYNALKKYNESHENKLYVFHGVWINEEMLAESLDAFEEENLKQFQNEMKKIVDAIHGNRVVEPETGHASGVYKSDISEYVIGWVLGIEWLPEMVLNTNEVYSELGDYNGEYFETKDAAPFEYWLAEQMDIITMYESETYNWFRPMSFTNWVTTDILDHPAEPSDNEDLVSVDPNVIYTKKEMNETNQFASYHVYPYYPDFLNFEESYQSYEDHRGEINGYAAYLNELNEVHRLPILIAEFGLPSSRGLTHENTFGLNQGYLTEDEQGAYLARIFEDIMAEKLLGGLIFTWQDEWFKRTWNTMDYDNPDRRPYWSNAQTGEQQFGLLSFDRHKVRIDGNTDDWETQPLYNKELGAMHSLSIDYDERYLYVKLDYNSKVTGHPIFLLDVVPDQGNYFVEGEKYGEFSNGVDILINLDKNVSRLLVDDYYDFYTYHYMHTLKLLKPSTEVPKKNSGKFSREMYALNKELYLPQQKTTVPFSSYEAGKLLEGNGNPDSPDYNSLADYSVSEKGVVELRLPWLLIRSKDPSQKEFVGDIYSDGAAASKFVEEIYIGALFVGEEGEVTDSFPAVDRDKLGPLEAFAWEKWDQVEAVERLKNSYYIVKELFNNY